MPRLIRRFLLAIVAALAVASGTFVAGEDQPAASSAKDNTVATAMGFEGADAWTGVPPDLTAADWRELDGYNRTVGKKPWPAPAVSRSDVMNAVTLSTSHVREGQFSGEWRNHPEYPTIVCTTVEPDWSHYGAIHFAAYSTTATGEVVTLGVQSDSPSTPALDYFLHDFTVDWTGWKEFTIPFADFHPLGQPAGWDHVDAIYFFTKTSERQPDPRTDLFLDAMALQPAPAGADNSKTTAASPAAGDDIYFAAAYTHDAPVNLNHDAPELAADAKNVSPFVQTPFFQGMRAREGYFPRYDAGWVYFDPQGHAYIHSPGVIETLDAAGRWQKHDLSGPLKDYARKKGWQGIALAWGGDPTVRFDADGYVYDLEDVKHVNADGKELDAKDRVALLLYSRDHAQTWTVLELPDPMSDFEKIDGHNSDALKNPPVIVLSDYGYFAWGTRAGNLLVPEKQADGTISLPPVVKFADDVLTGPVHSGAGNFVLTQGNKIFIVYGVVPSNEKMTPEELAQWQKATPPIPPNHPALKMHYPYPIEKREVQAVDGVPTFIRSYDRATKTLSDPVFLGYGGRRRDGHNWAAISADSKGILHVVINGHIDPLTYTHSLRPGDISAWSDPVYIPKEPGSPAYSYVSYASLTCDRHDNLICVVRSDTDDYNHRLAVMRKPADQPWEAEQSLLVPFVGGYHVWTDKVGYDALRDRLFVGYYDQSNLIQFSRADYLFYRFYWPDNESTLVSSAGKPNAPFNAGIPPQGKIGMFMCGPRESVVLFSDDSGKTWHLATTPDFEPKAADTATR